MGFNPIRKPTTMYSNVKPLPATQAHTAYFNNAAGSPRQGIPPYVANIPKNGLATKQPAAPKLPTLSAPSLAAITNPPSIMQQPAIQPTIDQMAPMQQTPIDQTSVQQQAPFIGQQAPITQGTGTPPPGFTPSWQLAGFNSMDEWLNAMNQQKQGATLGGGPIAPTGGPIMGPDTGGQAAIGMPPGVSMGW